MTNELNPPQSFLVLLRVAQGSSHPLTEYFAVFGRTWLSDCQIRLTR